MDVENGRGSRVLTWGTPEGNRAPPPPGDDLKGRT